MTRQFPPRGGSGPVAVLRGVSLRLEAGESLAICGPSGSGKSTLLNILGALDRPTEGVARFDGQDLALLTGRAQAAFRNRNVGFIFQLHHLLPQCTALENVLIPTLAGHDRDDHATAAGRGRALLERVGLGERLDHLPRQLSGGEQQRVAAVRELINSPRLLLADEPTGALDEEASDQVLAILESLRREQGAALIVVTHSDAVAGRMARRMVLRDGRVGGGNEK